VGASSLSTNFECFFLNNIYARLFPFVQFGLQRQNSGALSPRKTRLRGLSHQTKSFSRSGMSIAALKIGFRAHGGFPPPKTPERFGNENTLSSRPPQKKNRSSALV
jgi:hypothetical protein